MMFLIYSRCLLQGVADGLDCFVPRNDAKRRQETRQLEPLNTSRNHRSRAFTQAIRWDDMAAKLTKLC